VQYEDSLTLACPSAPITMTDMPNLQHNYAHIDCHVLLNFLQTSVDLSESSVVCIQELSNMLVLHMHVNVLHFCRLLQPSYLVFRA
jgi:hypothetical protein